MTTNTEDLNAMTEYWHRETNYVNNKVDEAFKAAQDHAYALGLARGMAEANKSEHRAITFGDIMHTQILAMRAAVVDAALNGPEAGMAWIENTLAGPGHLPDIDAARAEGGAQCMFNREQAEHEAFRAAHPAPAGPNAKVTPKTAQNT